MIFFAVLNKEIPLGKSLNALAHMSLGLGHRLDNTPGINVCFGLPDQVKKFRTLMQTHLPNTLSSDFTDTMTGQTAKEQLENTLKRKTEDLVYYATCGVIPQNSVTLFQDLLDICFYPNGYQPLFPVNEVIIKPAFEVKLSENVPDMKASLIIKKGLNLGQQLNFVASSCLEVGRNANFNDLYLMNFVDADDISHPYISYHPFPILNPGNPTKHKAMEKESRTDLVHHSSFNGDEPLVSIVFGNKERVDTVFSKKQTSLYKQELVKEDLAPIKKKISQAELLSDSMQKTLFIAEKEKEQIAELETSSTVAFSNKK